MLLPLVIVTAGICTYWNSLRSPFIWDDNTAVVSNRTIRYLSLLWDVFSPPRDTPVAGRPLVNLSFAINYAFGGLNETGYHIVNISIHVTCALLLFGIVRRTLMRLGSRGGSHDRRAVAPSPALFPAADVTALVTALLWMVHPLQTEVVDYITQRSESLMALFFLLTLYSAIRAQAIAGAAVTHKGDPGPGASRKRTADAKHTLPVNPWQALAIAACACGMLTKESMVVAPLIVVLYDWAFEFDSFRAAMRARRWLYAGLASTWVILAAVLWSVPRSTVGASAAVGAWTYLLNQMEVIGRYLRLSIWPSALVLDYGVPRSVALGDVLPGGLVIIGLIAAGGVALARSRALGFLAVWFFLTLAPTSSVIPITSEVGAERRMYLPLAALATLAVIGARAGFDRLTTGRSRPTTVQPKRPSTSPGGATDEPVIGVARITAAGLTVVILLALAGRTIARNAEYQNPLTLWRTDVERRPHGRSRMAFAGELVGAGQHDQAVAQFREAIKDFPDARLSFGAELILQQQQFEEGIAVLRQFIADGPSRPKQRAAHTLLAQAFAAQDKLDQAADEWRAILKDAPGDPSASASLAQVLSAQAQGGAATAQ
jgi:hypothetical protein